MQTVYLDNSATTQPSEAVILRMARSLREGFHNPSSLYAPAVQADKEMAACRELIQQRLGLDSLVVFTSGGTEANNLAVLGSGARRRGKGRLLYSAGEHPSVIAACKRAAQLGDEAVALPLDAQGRVDVQGAEALFTEQTTLICVMQVNNETGAIQPIREIAALRDRLCPKAWLHVDGVQGFLRVPIDCQALGVNSYALSAHKIMGPKGIGALWLRKPGAGLVATAVGGMQEEGLRAGTQNTPGIAGLMAAIAEFPAQNAMRHNKLRLWELLRDGIDGLHVNGPAPDAPDAADHILNASFPPVRAETMLHALEGEGIYVGNGAACSSRRKEGSHVLRAMGARQAHLDSAIRLSLSPYNTAEEMEVAARAAIRHYHLLRKYTRR